MNNRRYSKFDIEEDFDTPDELREDLKDVLMGEDEDFLRAPPAGFPSNNGVYKIRFVGVGPCYGGYLSVDRNDVNKIVTVPQVNDNYGRWQMLWKWHHHSDSEYWILNVQTNRYLTIGRNINTRPSTTTDLTHDPNGHRKVHRIWLIRRGQYTGYNRLNNSTLSGARTLTLDDNCAPIILGYPEDRAYSALDFIPG